MFTEFGGEGPKCYTWKEKEYEEVVDACKQYNLHISATFNLLADLNPQVFQLFVTLNNLLFTNHIHAPTKAGRSATLNYGQAQQFEGYLQWC
jgi:hypothetical protein